MNESNSFLPVVPDEVVLRDIVKRWLTDEVEGYNYVECAYGSPADVGPLLALIDFLSHGEFDRVFQSVRHELQSEGRPIA